MEFKNYLIPPQSLPAIEKMNKLGKSKIPFIFIIDFEMLKPVVISVENAEREGIKYIFRNNSVIRGKKDIKFKKHPVNYSEYKTAFDSVMKEISEGNTYLLNLTLPTKIDIDLTLAEIYNNSTAKYKLIFKNEFVIFSPETFVLIEKGIISSFPMKGTIDASLPDAEKMLLENNKEIAEHNTIVDLIRNDLSLVSKNVKVEKFRYVDKLLTSDKSLLQVSSKISGELPADYCEQIGDLIFGMLPAGSISGAPKKKTVEIIQSVEKIKRGYYTGICGIFDGGNLDSAVMIRYIENTPQGMFYRSGGGITHMSDAEYEYKELIDKVYVPII